MAGVVGQEADGREPDGARRSRWPGGRDGRVHEAQLTVARGSWGGMGQKFRWWAGRGQIGGKGHLEAR